MSQENVETVRRAYAALNSGDIPAVVGMCHTDVVLDNTNAVFDAAVYQGHAGLGEFFSLGKGMWESQRFEMEDVISLDADRVMVLQRIVSVGRDGVETTAHNAMVFTLRRGKAIQIKSFQTKGEALEAAGLRE